MLKFQEEMDELRASTMKMADVTVDMVEKSLRVLLDMDFCVVGQMVDNLEIVDRYDREIEANAIRILTLYQPIASDMRTVATYMKCITYMERIAKYCKNVAVAAQYLKDKPRYDVVECLKPMGEIATNMVETVINGLINATVEGFDQMSDMDLILDEGLHDGMDTIINFMESCPESADVCSYYLFMMRYMERIGDHACKIAEKVTFMVTGFHTVIG